MTNAKPSLRGQVAVAGVGETEYFKCGQAPDPEFKLALNAIVNACADAGIDPKTVDGFASYSNDRSDPSRLAAALGCHELDSNPGPPDYESALLPLRYRGETVLFQYICKYR